MCAQFKGPPTRRQGRLQKVLTGAPLDIVGVDVLFGLPATPDGKKYILVLTDYFTKGACAFALPDAEASTWGARQTKWHTCKLEEAASGTEGGPLLCTICRT